MLAIGDEQLDIWKVEHLADDLSGRLCAGRSFPDARQDAGACVMVSAGTRRARCFPAREGDCNDRGAQHFSSRTGAPPRWPCISARRTLSARATARRRGVREARPAGEWSSKRHGPDPSSRRSCLPRPESRARRRAPCGPIEPTADVPLSEALRGSRQRSHEVHNGSPGGHRGSRRGARGWERRGIHSLWGARHSGRRPQYRWLVGNHWPADYHDLQRSRC